jgi:hypothetical protein
VLVYELSTLGPYRSLDATMAQSNNCPFGVINTTIELNNTFDNNDISSVMFELRSVPVLLDVFGTILTSIIVLTPNGNFWNVPLLH